MDKNKNDRKGADGEVDNPSATNPKATMASVVLHSAVGLVGKQDETNDKNGLLTVNWCRGQMPVSPVSEKSPARPVSVADDASCKLEEYFINPQTHRLRLHTDSAQMNRAERGTLLHNMMAQVVVKEDIPAVLDRFERMGAFARQEREQFARELNKVVCTPDAASWFDGSWKVLSERTIMTNSGLFRPDRVMLRDGEVLVVDYKFTAKGDEHAKYCRQVQRYVSLLRAMGYVHAWGVLYYHTDGAVGEVVEAE